MPEALFFKDWNKDNLILFSTVSFSTYMFCYFDSVIQCMTTHRACLCKNDNYWILPGKNNEELNNITKEELCNKQMHYGVLIVFIVIIFPPGRCHRFHSEMYSKSNLWLVLFAVKKSIILFDPHLLFACTNMYTSSKYFISWWVATGIYTDIFFLCTAYQLSLFYLLSSEMWLFHCYKFIFSPCISCF